jgi:hypothetical protein
MNKSIRSLLSVAAVSAALTGFCTSAMADETQWQKDHPRRTEVNDRLANQNARIHNEVKKGDHQGPRSCTAKTVRSARRSAPWPAPTAVISPRPRSTR